MHRSHLLLATALLALASPPARAALPDPCQLVSGQAVAQALGGRLLEVRGLPPGDESKSRKCVYVVATQGSGGEQRSTIVLWLSPADYFTDLRSGQEKPPQEVKDLGDGAFQVFHDDTKRFDLFALKRNRATVEVTADTAEAARKVVELALGRL